MECLFPLDLKLQTKERETKNVLIPCSQCLACRLNKRDYLVTRIILEHQSNIMGQFWTLTLSPEGLSTFQKYGPRHLFRNFSRALRKYEKSKGNDFPIRFFGVTELGDLLGRPHIHCLVWNNLNTMLDVEPYKKGLPRLRHHIGQWPHGHVDACPLTLSSMRYVAKYVTKFNEDDPTAKKSDLYIFHPRKPSLGMNGLRQHLQSIANSPRRHWTQLPTIEIDGKTWAMDQRLLHQWYSMCRELGLKTEFPVSREDKAIQRHLKREEKTWSIISSREKKRAYQGHLYELTHAAYVAKQDALLSRALLSSRPAR